MFSFLDVIIFLFNVLTANKTKYLRRDFFSVSTKFGEKKVFVDNKNCVK